MLYIFHFSGFSNKMTFQANKIDQYDHTDSMAIHHYQQNQWLFEPYYGFVDGSIITSSREVINVYLSPADADLLAPWRAFQVQVPAKPKKLM